MRCLAAQSHRPPLVLGAISTTKSSFASPANLPDQLLALLETAGVYGADTPREPIARHLILEVYLANWRAEIMRVQPLLSRDMFQPDLASCNNVLEWQIFPGIAGGLVDAGAVGDAPIVVVVPMRVESDLLFCASAGAISDISYITPTYAESQSGMHRDESEGIRLGC
jgi:hypothetical protein